MLVQKVRAMASKSKAADHEQSWSNTISQPSSLSYSTSNYQTLERDKKVC